MRKRKFKVLKARGGMDASKADFKTPSASGPSNVVGQGGGADASKSDFKTPESKPSGGYGTNTLKPQATSQSKSPSIMPLSVMAAQAVLKPITEFSYKQQAKGETIFGNPKDLPPSRDYYRTTGKPLDPTSAAGKSYLKLGEPKKLLVNDPGNTRALVPTTCPDGSAPPCKTPTTQLSGDYKVGPHKTFLKGFQAYNDGGEVVISSNVDKDLL